MIPLEVIEKHISVPVSVSSSELDLWFNLNDKFVFNVIFGLFQITRYVKHSGGRLVRRCHHGKQGQGLTTMVSPAGPGLPRRQRHQHDVVVEKWPRLLRSHPQIPT